MRDHTLHNGQSPFMCTSTHKDKEKHDQNKQFCVFNICQITAQQGRQNERQ